MYIYRLDTYFVEKIVYIRLLFHVLLFHSFVFSIVLPLASFCLFHTLNAELSASSCPTHFIVLLSLSSHSAYEKANTTLKIKEK